LETRHRTASIDGIIALALVLDEGRGEARAGRGAGVGLSRGEDLG
jgi:hypothetical protein